MTHHCHRLSRSPLWIPRLLKEHTHVSVVTRIVCHAFAPIWVSKQEASPFFSVRIWNVLHFLRDEEAVVAHRHLPAESLAMLFVLLVHSANPQCTTVDYSEALPCACQSDLYRKGISIGHESNPSREWWSMAMFVLYPCLLAWELPASPRMALLKGF
jgi:hypothetical protein